MALTAATALSRFSSLAALALATHYLPLFDASPKLHAHKSWLRGSLLRWDTFHFQGIADHGYVYEHQWAFLPGTSLLLKIINNEAVWLMSLLVLACKSTRALYQLTMHHFPQSPSFAQLVSFLSLLSSSPATLHFAPYAEPFFTYLSYQGMLHAAKEHWLLASVYFALATSFRSNGVFLCGYIGWGMIVEPFLASREVSPRKASTALLLSMMSISPFLYHNYLAYLAFCQTEDALTIPEWCERALPSIYTYVQATYWNNGFLRYWTLAQIPNFLLATPPLALMCAFSLYFCQASINALWGYSRPLPTTVPLSILPHVLHTIFLSFTLFLFSHTQIVLRLAASLPTLYWAAAFLLVFTSTTVNRVWSNMWVWWSFTWGLISLGLWAAFLPPA